MLNRHDDTLSGDNRRLSQAEFLPSKQAPATAGGSHHGVRSVNRADLSGASFVINGDDDHRPTLSLSPAVSLGGPTAREAHEGSPDIADTWLQITWVGPAAEGAPIDEHRSVGRGRGLGKNRGFERRGRRVEHANNLENQGSRHHFNGVRGSHRQQRVGLDPHDFLCGDVATDGDTFRDAVHLDSHNRRRSLLSPHDFVVHVRRDTGQAPTLGGLSAGAAFDLCPGLDERSLLGCLRTEPMARTTISDTKVGDHRHDIVGGRLAMADQPATHDRAGAADSTPAVHIDRTSRIEFAVEVIEDRRHLRHGRNTEIRNLEPADGAPITDGTVVVAKVCVRPSGPVLRQVHEVVNASRQQILDHLDPPIRSRLAGVRVGTGSESARHDPVGTIGRGGGHRCDQTAVMSASFRTFMCRTSNTLFLSYTAHASRIDREFRTSPIGTPFDDNARMEAFLHRLHVRDDPHHPAVFLETVQRADGFIKGVLVE